MTDRKLFDFAPLDGVYLREPRELGGGIATLFADVSEFQADVNNAYPYRFLSFRSNDGTYRDHHFAMNLAWAKHACDTGRMDGFLVYFVYETNWQDTLATWAAAVGTPHPKMAVMLDVESWGGKIRGNHSTTINACREGVIARVGHNRKRVVGYANAGDFANLWPSRGDAKVVLANYSGNPSFPGKIAHQFSDRYTVPPFGACDINSADGLTPAQFATALGLITPPPPKPPTPTPKPATKKERDMLFYQVDKADCAARKVTWPGVFTRAANQKPEHVLDNVSATGIGADLGVAYGANMPEVSYAQHTVYAAGTAALLEPHPDAKMDELHAATSKPARKATKAAKR